MTGFKPGDNASRATWECRAATQGGPSIALHRWSAVEDEARPRGDREGAAGQDRREGRDGGRGARPGHGTRGAGAPAHRPAWPEWLFRVDSGARVPAGPDASKGIEEAHDPRGARLRGDPVAGPRRVRRLQVERQVPALLRDQDAWAGRARADPTEKTRGRPLRNQGIPIPF